jgi:hypothetical protein
VVPLPAAPASDPGERLVAGFVAYLVRERGLGVDTNTVYGYERSARLFLSGRVDLDGGGLEHLTAAESTTAPRHDRSRNRDSADGPVVHRKRYAIPHL